MFNIAGTLFRDVVFLKIILSKIDMTIKVILV